MGQSRGQGLGLLRRPKGGRRQGGPASKRLWANPTPPSSWQNGPLLFCSCPGGLGFRPAPSSSSQRPGSVSLGFWPICFARGQQEDSPPIIKRLGDSPRWSLSLSQEARGGSWQEGRSPFSRGTWGPADSSRLAPGLASPLRPACPFGNKWGLRQGHTQTSSISSG